MNVKLTFKPLLIDNLEFNFEALNSSAKEEEEELRRMNNIEEDVGHSVRGSKFWDPF